MKKIPVPSSCSFCRSDLEWWNAVRTYVVLDENTLCVLGGASYQNRSRSAGSVSD